MRYFEDFTVGDVAEFGRYEVTREEIVAFASQYDPQSFHLSDEGAKGTIFKGLSASGWHTCAMTMRMMVEHMTASGATSIGSPGVDELRWLQPVYPGDILRVRQEVLEVRASQRRPGIGSVKSRTTVLNQKDDAVMTMLSIGLILRRPTQ